MQRITKVIGLAPAVGPYSFAVVAGDLVYTAGQIGQTAEAKLIDGGIEAETHQVMKNLGAILHAAGSGFEKVTKTSIYLTDPADFPKVNEIYASYFPNGQYPARETTIAAALPLGAKIEISIVAVKERA